MTKKHFIALADAIRATRPASIGYHDDGTSTEIEQWERDVRSLAAFCAAQNPRFNRERWMGYVHGTNGPSGGAVRKPKADEPVYHTDGEGFEVWSG